MLHKRYAFDVATLGDFIYVVGGSNGAQCLNAVERYDPRRNQWTSEVSMGTCRAGVSVSVLNGCLYAVGGCSLSTLNTVERLDPRVGKWESLRPMSTHRSHLGCAALDGYLYAVGGRTGWDYSLSSVWQYNPLTNEWTAVAEMMVKRSGVKTIAVNGSLYAVGGFDGTFYLDTVEVLDPGTDQWSIHSNMNTERCRAGVAVI